MKSQLQYYLNRKTSQITFNEIISCSNLLWKLGAVYYQLPFKYISFSISYFLRMCFLYFIYIRPFEEVYLFILLLLFFSFFFFAMLFISKMVINMFPIPSTTFQRIIWNIQNNTLKKKYYYTKRFQQRIENASMKNSSRIYFGI